MPRPKTELEQRCPSPPYTRWDQRGNPVLLTYLEKKQLMDGKSVCLSLETDDPDIAKRHMRVLVPMLVAEGRLSPDSGAAKEYGRKGTRRSRLVEIKVRRLKTLSEAKYGSEALAIAKRLGLPVGIIHNLAGRKPALSAGTYRTRRMRARKHNLPVPKGNTWEHRAQGGKYWGWNGNVLTGRLQMAGRPWHWPLKGIDGDEKKAEALMRPVRVARKHLQQAACEELKESGTDAAMAAGAARVEARARLTGALITAGAPKMLVELVLKGPKEEVGTAVPPPSAAIALAPRAVLGATKRKQAAEKEAKQILMDRYDAYVKNGRKQVPLKDELRTELTSGNPDLSSRGFDKVWKETAVAEGWDWAKPGFRH